MAKSQPRKVKVGFRVAMAFVKGLRHCALVGFCWDEFLNGCSPDLLFGTENELSQKNHEGWLVGVWDGDSWDPSHRFRT